MGRLFRGFFGLSPLLCCMVFDDRTERLIFRNRALLTQAEAARVKRSVEAMHAAEARAEGAHVRQRAPLFENKRR